MHDVTYHPNVGPRMRNVGYEISERDAHEHKSDPETVITTPPQLRCALATGKICARLEMNSSKVYCSDAEWPFNFRTACTRGLYAKPKDISQSGYMQRIVKWNKRERVEKEVETNVRGEKPMGEEKTEWV